MSPCGRTCSTRTATRRRRRCCALTPSAERPAGGGVAPAVGRPNRRRLALGPSGEDPAGGRAMTTHQQSAGALGRPAPAPVAGRPPPRGLTARLDAFQQRHPGAAFPLAIVYKYFDDFGPYLAALLTYYAFVSLFPLLLLLSTILGYALRANPGCSTRSCVRHWASSP